MPTKISVTTAPTLVSAAKERQFVAIQNQSDVAIYLAWDANASAVTIDTGAAPGFKIAPNDSFLLAADFRHPVAAFSGAMYAVHGGAGSKAISLQET